MIFGTDTKHYKKVAEIQIYKGDNGLYDLWIDNCQYHDITWQRLMEIIGTLK